MIVEELNIWTDDKVPVVIMNAAGTETKEFQIWNDVIVPFVDIYDTAPTRRRVMEF